MSVVFSYNHPGRTDSDFTLSCSELLQNSSRSCLQALESPPQEFGLVILSSVVFDQKLQYSMWSTTSSNKWCLKDFWWFLENETQPSQIYIERRMVRYNWGEGTVQREGTERRVAAASRDKHGPPTRLSWPDELSCLWKTAHPITPCTVMPTTYSQHDQNPASASFTWKSHF